MFSVPLARADLEIKEIMNTFMEEGFTTRPVVISDIAPIVQLYNVYLSAGGLNRITTDDLTRDLTLPGFNIEDSTRLVMAPGGSIAGFAWVGEQSQPPVHPTVRGCVHTGFERHGIGSYLMRWAEARSARFIEEVPPGIRVSISVSCSELHQKTRQMLEKLDYRQIRNFLFMIIGLHQVLPGPSWPEGITLRTYRDYPDLPALLRAVNEAFRDHWGQVPVEEEKALEQTKYRIEHDPKFDPTLWFMVMDDDKIAGAALCRAAMDTDNQSGYIMTLGIRRPWRRRGLALNLLYHVFNEYRDRGYKQVGLDVDAQSLTGATRLYTKAGMQVKQKTILYGKGLREGRELATQAIE